MKKPTKQAKSAQPGASDGIDELISTIKDELADAKGIKDKLGLLGELRKAESLRIKRNSELSLAVVIAWIRQQSKDVQAQVTRELYAIEHRKGGVL